MTRRERSPAQQARQLEAYRDRGRYSKVNPCFFCGRSAGVSYFSHPLTDCLDSEGVSFADLGLCLCGRCATATHGITTVRGCLQFMAAKLGAKCPAWVHERLAALPPAPVVQVPS